MKTYREYLINIRNQYGDSIAYQWINNNELVKKTYKEYVEDVYKYVNYINSICENPKQKHFGIISKNSYDYVVCLLGVLCSEGVAVPINYNNETEEFLYEINYADLDYIFIDTYNVEKYKQTLNSWNINSIEKYQQFESNYNIFEQENNFLSMLMFTSGSSTKSKCVMLSKKNILSCIDFYHNAFGEFSEYANYREKHGILLMLPMFHVMTISNVVGYMSEGYRIDICTNIKNLYRDLSLFKSKQLVCVPMIVSALCNDIENGEKEKLENLSFIFSGGAPVIPNQVEKLEKCGIVYLQGYGMTETFGGITQNLFCKSKKYDSIGKILDNNCKIEVIDDELCVCADCVMMGYYKNEEETHKILIDGKLHTGDLGYVDEENYYYITGKKKNLIILSNGENINPEVLETNLLKNKLIREIKIKEDNNEICAEIYCNNKDEASIKKYVSSENMKLPYYKRVTKVVFRNVPFEHTASGKIKRN